MSVWCSDRTRVRNKTTPSLQHRAADHASTDSPAGTGLWTFVCQWVQVRHAAEAGRDGVVQRLSVYKEGLDLVVDFIL